MKRAVIIFGIAAVLLAAVSCSNRFLDENEVDLYSLSDTLFITSYDENVRLSLQTPLDDDYEFTIFKQPRWLSFKSMHGKIKDGAFTLDLSVLHEDVPAYYPISYGTVFLDVEGFGMVSFTVVYSSYRNASIQFYPSTFFFASVFTQELVISNTGQGLLAWEINSKPDWVTVSLIKGTLYPGNSQIVEVGILTEMLTPGEFYTGAIKILSSAGFGYFMLPVTVKLPVTPPTGTGQVTSILTDAEYHHDSGIMAICTKSPNQLLLFNTNTGVTDTIKLEKTPGCISFTEDGHKALIGYTVASVSYIDIDNRKITADYNIDCIPYDIVPGENGWCYITPVSDQWVMLRNLNLNTGEVITSTTAASIYEKTVIRKVPGKPYMVGSQLPLSTSGLLLFDLTGGQANDAVTNYFESIGHFWLSKDGNRLYSAYGNVYILPGFDGQYHLSSLSVYGKINSESSYINAFDDSPAINSVFVSSAYWQDGTSSLIEQFNTVSLNKIKTFNVSPVLLNLAGTNYLCETSPRFIFAKKDGSALYVLKSPKKDSNIEGWFMETIVL